MVATNGPSSAICGGSNSSQSGNSSSANVWSRDVVIHVFDEYRKTAKDFTCARDLLISQMKYFQSYLTQSNEHEEIDISVHCDIDIFEWLMEYMHENPSGINYGGSGSGGTKPLKRAMTMENIASILVSSEFLQMDQLFKQCIAFVVSHLQDFLHLRVDFNCLSDAALQQIAKSCDLSLLESLQDPKDRLLWRLYQKKIDQLLEKLRLRGISLEKCAHCGLVCTRPNIQRLCNCSRGTRVIGRHGQLLAFHEPMEPSNGWKVDAFVSEFLAKKPRATGHLYWGLYACTVCLVCAQCGQWFNLNELDNCRFHRSASEGSSAGASAASGAAVVGSGSHKSQVSNNNSFECCQRVVFDCDELLLKGCCRRDHVIDSRRLEELQKEFVEPLNVELLNTSVKSKLTLLGIDHDLPRPSTDRKIGCGNNNNSMDTVPPPVELFVVSKTKKSNHFKGNNDENLQQVVVGSSLQRKQYRALDLQAKDREYFQQLTKRLLLARISARK